VLLGVITTDPRWHGAARRALESARQEKSKPQAVPAAADSGSKAQELFRRKRYEEGVAVLEKAPKAAAHLRMDLAWVYFHSNSLEKLIRLLENPKPDSSQAAYLLGAAYKQLASQALERLVTIAPESARAHALMGDSLYARELYGEAVTEYNAALKAQPGDPELLFSLGNAHFKSLEFEKAADAYTKVLAANPWHSAASHMNGRSLLLLNRPEDALAFLRKAIELDPGFKEAHAALGRALATLGSIEEAIKHLDAGAASDTDGNVHFQLFQLYRKVGNNEKAEEARKRSLALRKAAEESDEAAR
jgi:tetratricopeptide (TPR) repeat protein